jgi:hypothetical protein
MDNTLIGKVHGSTYYQMYCGLNEPYRSYWVDFSNFLDSSESIIHSCSCFISLPFICP